MKINIKDLKIYFLTTGKDQKRRNHIINTFKEYNITEVHPILGISKFKSGATGIGRCIDLGLRRQDRTKPFQPFLVIEDDVSFYQKRESIEIPDDTDIFYVGISNWRAEGNTHVAPIYAEHHNADIVRIYNMLSNHAIIVASALGASVYQRCMLEAFFKNKNYDLPLAHCQNFYNCYALKKPLLYQDKAVGGDERYTKFEITKYTKPTKIPTYVNITDSIKMVYRKK